MKRLVAPEFLARIRIKQDSELQIRHYNCIATDGKGLNHVWYERYIRATEHIARGPQNFH